MVFLLCMHTILGGKTKRVRTEGQKVISYGLRVEVLCPSNQH